MDPPTPFFGSKISLISKSKIRYEGFLYNIDPNDSTIALAKGELVVLVILFYNVCL